MTNSNTLTYRVGQLEKCTDQMDSKLDMLINNDIHHLQLEMQALKVRINVLTYFNVGAIILALLIGKFL